MSVSLGMAARAQEWQRMGPAGGMVISMSTGSRGTTYLGTADGHVFAREGVGKNWELRGRIGQRTDAVVSRLLVDPRQDDKVFAAIWYQKPGVGGGVFRSEDGGRTWRALGLEKEAVRALESAPTQSNLIVAGTRSGVFRSVDAGMNWERISPEGDEELRNLDSLAIDPRDANIIYAGTYHLPWKTTDGGKNWKPVINGLIDDSDIMSLRIDASKPDRLFLSACSGIYRSENQGESWSKLQGIPYAARRTQAIVQDLASPQTLYAATTEGLWVTEDAGESWSRTTPQDWVINSVSVVAGEGNTKEQVLMGTESRGVLSSEDVGRTFVGANNGFAHQVVRQLVGDPRDAKHLAMLMEREGMILWESHDAGQNWTALPLASEKNSKGGMFVAEQVERFFGSPWGWIARANNGRLWQLDEREAKWKEWKLRVKVEHASKAVRNKQAGTKKAVSTWEPVALAGTVLEFSRADAYVGARQGLLRCDSGGSCVALKAFGHPGVLGALQVSSDGATLRAIADEKLATSRDGGQTAVWGDIPESTNSVLWVNGEERNGKPRIFLGTREGLFVSEDNGASWKRQEQGLPGGQVEHFLKGRSFLAASLREGGFYVSRDSGKTWTRQDQDEERSRFTGLLETDDGVLLIGSQSEGVLRWRSPE